MKLVSWGASLLLATGFLVAPAPAPVQAGVSVVSAVRRDDTTPIPVPPLETSEWDGQTGITLPGSPFLRNLVADIADLNEEPEIREAAAAALASTEAGAIELFLSETFGSLQSDIDQRHAATAQQNLGTIQAMAGTGPAGGYFNAEVTRVLRGSDADREQFLAYGADIARGRDQQTAATEADRRKQLRDRLTALVASAPDGSETKRAANAALAGDDAAVAAFWNTGYLTAAKADAAAREQYLADLEARNKAAEDLSDLAQRAARASEARRRMLVAHGNAVRELERASNAMAGAANAARSAQRILAGGGTDAEISTQLAAARTETQAQLTAAQQAADRAEAASAAAVTESQILIDTGLDYGAEWSRIVQGMHQAAVAAVGAATTAAHAVDATIATHNAQTAADRAEAHRQEAEKWREHAEEHAAAAAKLAEAAKAQADAAKTAAARAKTAREQAQAAESRARASAAQTHQDRLTAESEAATAHDKRLVAEKERQTAAEQRARAEAQAAVAANARRAATAQAGVAAAAAEHSERAADAAGTADEAAWDRERAAGEARDAAYRAEHESQGAVARAQAYAKAAAEASGDDKAEAQRQADAAARDATQAQAAARAARDAANTATGAAATARAAATESGRAAARAEAAAEDAQAAAARADAAADQAEADAKATHQARLEADGRAADATAEEATAAEAARAAAHLAEQAQDESVQALWAAQRTQQEAEAATTESVAASAQADIAVSAATAAAASSAGIAEPLNTALAMVSPFTATDIDADYVTQVIAQARVIGAEQAAAAQQRANEAVAAAQRAAAAAQAANEETKKAFEASAAAAQSAADAAASAADAKKSAADAAAEAATARAAAAGAAEADAQAKADAQGARNAANAAADDAAIAGRSAADARADANRAAAAAQAAERDAVAARGAATAAEADAARAQANASAAQKSADSAAAAAEQALQHAIDAQKAAYQAEDASKQQTIQWLTRPAGNDDPPDSQEVLPYLTPEQVAEWNQLKEQSGEDIMDFLTREGEGLLLDLTGIPDLISCLRDGDIEACLWTLLMFVPWTRLYIVAEKIGRVIPKLVRFFEESLHAVERLNELREIAERARQCRNPHSFLAGTPVLLADGSTEPIEDVDVGELVRATDPATGITTSQPVTQLIPGQGREELVDLTVADADGVGRISATAGHLFWQMDTGTWVEAGDLRAGAHLRTSNGARVELLATAAREAEASVYNFTVANVHTYFVLAGNAPLLVHNAGPCGPDINALSAAGRVPKKNGLTAAGYAYQKHMGRGQLPKVGGTELDSAGQTLLDDILTDPRSDFQAIETGNFVGGLRVISTIVINDKFIGAIFNADGGLEYFGVFS